ncbi:hypothetical protein [Lewinella sp. LCG006]|uniref:hypothetical protein n=1 Tax=Lewinella sp. LCG006 TaxID=3231911 RepID=UPI00345F59D9
MSLNSQSLSQEADKIFPSTSDFHFPGMSQSLRSVNENEDPGLLHGCYELVPKGELAPKLKLVFKNGNRCTFPYAYLLRTEFDVQGTLTVFTSEKVIVIHGRGLDELENRLYDSQVKWISES